jgi:thiol-disulfide isomerase/thioredoxin
LNVAPGLIALAAALAVSVATGLVWQRTNGRIRGVRTGRIRGVRAGSAPAPGGPQPQAAEGPVAETGPVLTGAELGLPLGQRATLVQFSTAFCAPCRATRRILAEVAGMIDGVAHVEIDAESHLDLVRRLDIRRTPTVLVVGPDGRIAKRASGQPRKADVIAAVGEVP